MQTAVRHMNQRIDVRSHLECEHVKVAMHDGRRMLSGRPIEPIASARQNAPPKFWNLQPPRGKHLYYDSKSHNAPICLLTKASPPMRAKITPRRTFCSAMPPKMLQAMPFRTLVAHQYAQDCKRRESSLTCNIELDRRQDSTIWRARQVQSMQRAP
jgi:hypothetical protein